MVRLKTAFLRVCKMGFYPILPTKEILLLSLVERTYIWVSMDMWCLSLYSQMSSIHFKGPMLLSWPFSHCICIKTPRMLYLTGLPPHICFSFSLETLSLWKCQMTRYFPSLLSTIKPFLIME